jgi:phosphoribosylamine---glycine ligase
LRFFFVSGYNCVTDPARRLKEAGHDVLLAFEEGCNDTFDGLVEKADWRGFEEDPERIVVFDDTGHGALQDRLRAEGRLVVGGSEAGERLELDRHFGQDVCRSIGLPTAPCCEFSGFHEAIDFVDAHPRRWVVKRNGLDKHRILDYQGTAPDGRDVRSWLRFLAARRGQDFPARFLMQEHITGVEVAVGAFFNGRDWVMPYGVNFEHQRLMPGEIGPNTGEMYTTLWHRSDRQNRIFSETLEPMTDFFRAQHHVGYVDLNGIVNESGFHPLEWTVRFGMPIFMAHCRMLSGGLELAEFYRELAAGTLDRYETAPGYAISAVVAAPPFPCAGYETLSKGMPVFLPEDPDALEHIHFFEIRREPDGAYVTAGTHGYCFVVTDVAPTPEEAGRRVLRRIESIHGVPWLYRSDLGAGETEKLRLLAQYGFGVSVSA